MQNIITSFFDLLKGEDNKEKTLEAVKHNISFRGANLWILACAILIASVGLNVNSTAVIIGAMLISPLMGPIVGAGFALGIYDFLLLKKSLRNLLVATVAGLLVSTVYFYLSPFKEVQSELLARTAPNIYDILIAFFGGLVGVIAVTRVEKGNPIPGVAIATALMPPLCTAGYGLATAHYTFFFGALFLYSINCVFICISTFLIVKYLKYPAKQIDVKYQKQVKYSITALIVLLLTPSAYFAYSLYNQQKFTQSVNMFIEKEFTDNGETIIYKKTNYSATPKTIELAFLSKHFTSVEIDSFNEKLNSYNIPQTKLIIKEDSTLNVQNLKNDILNEVRSSDTVLYRENLQMKLAEAETTQPVLDSVNIFREANVIFPEITSLSFLKCKFYTLKDSTYFSTVLIYQSKKDLQKEDEIKLQKWINQRLATTNTLILKK